MASGVPAQAGEVPHCGPHCTTLAAVGSCPCWAAPGPLWGATSWEDEQSEATDTALLSKQAGE